MSTLHECPFTTGHEFVDISTFSTPLIRRMQCIRCGVTTEEPLTMPPGDIQFIHNPLTWTTDAPNVPGWFWFQDFTLKIGPVIVMWTGSTYSLAGVEGTFPPSDQSQWMGPLDVPR